MRRSLFKRIKRAFTLEIRRIKDEHRPVRRHRRRPPLSVRFRHRLKKIKDWKFSSGQRRPSKPHLPPLSHRIKYSLHKYRQKYAVVLSSKYLIITLNSTVLFLVSFFLIHFLTHLVTGITAWFCDISTTLNYTFVDFHIRYWNWTEEMVILVFSIPALFTILISLLSSLAFVKDLKRPGILRWFRSLTKKQRRKQRHKQRQRELELQVQRLNKTAQEPIRQRHKKKLSWTIRLFLLWLLYHSATYFFSGMIYGVLFHRRFAYVIWYAFNSPVFDFMFSIIAFLSMVAIGYVFSIQFFNSGRMYLNDLNDRNRMPFVLSQAIFPFIIGTFVTILLQIPVFDPALILLNFSMFFLLLPLPSRAAHFDNLHFDNNEKPGKINWKWIVWSSIVILSILIAIKIGIQIRLP